MRFSIVLVTLLFPVPATAQETSAPATESAATADGATADGATADAASATNAAAEANGLGAIPYPDLDALESDVAEQLREIEGIVQSLLTGPRPEQETLQDAYAELGRHYHAYGLEEAAEASYRNALRLSPRDFQILYLLGVLHQQKGDLGEADAVFQAVLELRPNDLATLVREGEVMRAQNRPDMAEKLFAYALKIDPDCAAARAGLGEIALAHKEHQTAVSELERALELVPAANRLHYSLAMAYRGLGDRDKARDHLTRHGTVGVKPPDPLVDELETLKRGERGLPAARPHRLQCRPLPGGRQGLRRRGRRPPGQPAVPGSTSAPLSVSSATPTRRSPSTAQPSSSIPTTAPPTSTSDRCSPRRERSTRRCSISKRPSPATTTTSQAHLEIARVLQRAGRFEDAREHFARVVQLDPLSEDRRLGEAGALAAEGRYAEALDLLEKAHAVLPTQGRTTHALARFLAGNPELELRDGERAFTLALRVFGAVRRLRRSGRARRRRREGGGRGPRAELSAPRSGLHHGGADRPQPGSHADRRLRQRHPAHLRGAGR